MSAEPDPTPDWTLLRPPPEGWTADDLDRLAPGMTGVEMIDGALVVMAPQTSFHSGLVMDLARSLDDAAPPDVEVHGRMTVKLGPRQRPEPDVVAARLRIPDLRGLRTCFLPDEILLVVEIVSTESELRDRRTKPILYAEAGIPHFWRIEREGDQPVVHVFELEQMTGTYVATGIHRDIMRLQVPFPMAIDLPSLTR